MINWKHIDTLIEKFNKLGLKNSLNYDFFNQVAITHHSTSLEGATLTLIETQLLLEEGITAKGKPLNDHNMVKDHYEAIKFAIGEAAKKRKIAIDFLLTLNALVMKSTGSVINQAHGSYDSSKGEIRKGSVVAGNTFFPDSLKVPKLLDQLCDKLNEHLDKVTDNKTILQLSFQAHSELVGIHPWADGNGRTSRLLMNYIQAYHDLPLGIVYKEDKGDYIEALEKSRDEVTSNAITNFMAVQYIKFLEEQLSRPDKAKSGVNFVF